MERNIDWKTAIDRVQKAAGFDAELNERIARLQAAIAELEAARPGALGTLPDRPTTTLRGADLVCQKLQEKTWFTFRAGKKPDGVDDAYLCRASVHVKNLARHCRERVQELNAELAELDCPAGSYDAFEMQHDELHSKWSGERAEDLRRHRQKGHRRPASLGTR